MTDRRGLDTAVATKGVADAMMVSGDVASNFCKRRSSLGVGFSLAATLPNLTWRNTNIPLISVSNLMQTYF